MQTTNELLDRIKTDQKIPSDYRLAQVLEVTKNAITNYRYGKSRPNDEVGLRMAELLKADAGYITACLHAERAQSPEVRQLWEKVAKRLQAGVSSIKMMLLIAIFSIAAGAYPAWAAVYLATSSVNVGSLYIVEVKQRTETATTCRWLVFCGWQPPADQRTLCGWCGGQSRWRSGLAGF